MIQIQLLILKSEQTLSEDSESSDVIRFVKSKNLLYFLMNMFRFDKGIFMYQQLNITGKCFLYVIKSNYIF